MHQAGTVVCSKYQIERLLGEGGMGSVFSALHLTTKRRVALKFLKKEYCEDGVVVARFIREARAAGTLDHPNTIQIIDVAQDDGGAPLLVMEYLDGESLAQTLSRGRLTVQTTAMVMVPVLSALAHAHAKGIIHRDMKPENIFLAKRGGEIIPKILDFGIAKVLKDDEQPNKMTLTSTGTMLGTPYYMSPEQVAGRKDLDHRCDIWAVGVILYECLAGRKPFTGENFGQLFAALLQDEPPPIFTVAPDVPPDLARVVHHCLAKRRDDRIGYAGEITAALAPHAGLEMPNLPMPTPALHSGMQRLPTPAAGHRLTPVSGQQQVPFSTPVSVRGVYTPSGVRPLGTPVPLNMTPPATPMRWSTPGANRTSEVPRESSSTSRTLMLVGVLGGLSAVATVIVLAAAGVFDRRTDPVAASDTETVAPVSPGQPAGGGPTGATPTDPSTALRVADAVRARPEPNACYQDARRSNPGLAGRLVVSVDVGSDGSALAVRSVEGIEDEPLRRCVERQLLRGIQVPGWQSGAVSGVLVPLTFAPPLLEQSAADAGAAAAPSGDRTPRIRRGGPDRPPPVAPPVVDRTRPPPPERPRPTGTTPSSSGIFRELGP